MINYISLNHTIMKSFLTILLIIIGLSAQGQSNALLLKPDRVFDGLEVHNNWVVLVEGNKIVYAGIEKNLPKHQAKTIVLANKTLLPGLIEGHGHILLHPYNETSWNDQVLKEPESYRVARAVNHAKATLEAGFTTFRDLGTEGAGYADLGIKMAIDEGIIAGPRMLISSKAIVATGSYGPKGFSPDFDLPLLGAEPADGNNLIQVVRSQIGKGADFIKVYADYRWGPNGEAMPSFTEAELQLIVEVAASSGRDVVAHAATAEGMKRAINAGVVMIEHGDGATDEVYQLMKEKNVALYPTLAAGYSISTYNGWNPDREPAPERVVKKRKSFEKALAAGVTLSAGGDVGVYSHGNNVIELEMMAEYGMKPIDVLIAATSLNAKLFHMEQKVGSITEGLLADIVIVNGNPMENISALRDVNMVMKDGVIYVDNNN